MSEHDEQKALFQWAEIAQLQRPELALMFAIPNGGHRLKAVAGKMKAEGVKPGVPDIFLPVPRQQYHGLFVEMKTQKGAISKEQHRWIRPLLCKGYQVKVCRGWQAAAEVIEQYLGGE